jgi:hypothetical protein
MSQRLMECPDLLKSCLLDGVECERMLEAPADILPDLVSTAKVGISAYVRATSVKRY